MKEVKKDLFIGFKNCKFNKFFFINYIIYNYGINYL